MKKSWQAATAVAAATALILTGCSDPSAPDTVASGPVTWPAQDTNRDGTTLTVWASANSTTIPASVVDGFEKLTGATVKVVTIPDPYEQGVQTKVATGDKPDLAFWQPTPSQLSALNAKMTLQPLDGAPWLDNYTGNLADITGTLDDTRYAALISSPSVEGIYYNKEVFAEAGITDTPANWDEMIADAHKVKDIGVTPFYEMGVPGWSTQWWVHTQLADAAADGLWDRVNANKEKFTDPTIQGAIENYKAMIHDGLFNADIKTSTFADQGDALLAGDAGMVMQVNSYFSQLQSAATTEELNEKIGFFPISPSGNVGTVVPDQSNALVAFKTGDADREAASRQLLSYWLGDGYDAFAQDQSTVSIMTGVDTPAAVPQALLDVAASVEGSVGSMQALAVANPDLYLYLANMIQGTMSAADVAAATQDQFEQLATAQGVPGF